MTAAKPTVNPSVRSDWTHVMTRISGGESVDAIRKDYVDRIAAHTGRNVIAYYSGFVQKPARQDPELQIIDDDLNGLMTCISAMPDKSKGLDLVLHTPGGQVSAAKHIGDYLFEIFGKDIRVIVPHMAMSAGTMISLSSREIIMGKPSSLGPIDPQFGPMSAHGILEEFSRAKSDYLANPQGAQAWGPILSKYHPTLIGKCEKAIELSNSMVTRWLHRNMFSRLKKLKRDKTIKELLDSLAKEGNTLAHDRHFNRSELRDFSLKIVDLEKDKALQDAVMGTHHAFTCTFTMSSCLKIIQSTNGRAYIRKHG